MRLVPLVLALSAASCASAPAADTSASRSGETTSSRDLSDGTSPLAKTLVARCAGVREGEMVLVSGGAKDVRLLEDVATEVRRAGAHALVRLNDDRLDRLSYTQVPERFDANTPLLDLKLAETIDAEIAVDPFESESQLDDLPPARLAARGRAQTAVSQMLMRRQVRQVFLGNDLRPTSDRARRLGISLDDLTRAYYDGLAVDYDALETTAAGLRNAMEHAKTLRITAGNGTDLTVALDGRRAFANDGVVSKDDVARGGAAVQAWLPAGEVYVAPRAADGRVVIDQGWWGGSEYRRLVLEFRGGRLASMQADSGIDRLKEEYAAGGAGKDLFGAVDVGINPNLAGRGLRTFAASGAVTIAFGANTWAGGDNTADFAFVASIPGATLTADGEAFVRDGRLVR